MTIANALYRLNQAEQSPASGPAAVQAAVRDAANTTGVNFSYLMAKAAQESSFDPSARAAGSSATGLYQFIDSTWLRMVQAHGDKYGLGNYAAAIDNRSDGSPVVSDPKLRQEILDLRKDPRLSAMMAAEFTKDNKTALQQSVGGQIGGTELYLAHFLGANGASKFLNAMKQNPDQSAVTLFPDAASSNRSVFYDRNGAPQTLRQIYDRFAAKFQDGGSDAGRFANGYDPGAWGGNGGSSTGSASSFGRVVGQTKEPMSLFTVMVLSQLHTPEDPALQRRSGRNDNSEATKTLSTPNAAAI